MDDNKFAMGLNLDLTIPRERKFYEFLEYNRKNGINRKQSILRLFDEATGQKDITLRDIPATLDVVEKRPEPEIKAAVPVLEVRQESTTDPKQEEKKSSGMFNEYDDDDMDNL